MTGSDDMLRVGTLCCVFLGLLAMYAGSLTFGVGFFVLALFASVPIARADRGGTLPDPDAVHGDDEARRRLRIRYAEGDLSDREFERKRERLRENDDGTAER